MDENTLLAILEQLESASLGTTGSELSADRDRANDYYLGRAVGNLAPSNEPDRTTVVSRDLMEVTEWTLPELLRIFLAGEPVEFVPNTPADEKAARQETAVVNHVILQKNPGYLIFRTWFQDALIERNGYVHCYWDDRSITRREKYENLTEQQMLQLTSDIALRRQKMDLIDKKVDDATGLTTIEIDITTPAGQVCIENVPPERMRVSEDAMFSLQDASYVARLEYIPRYQLLEQGFDAEKVSQLADQMSRYDAGETTRNTVTNEATSTASDSSMDRIPVWQAWARIDADGDGLAELLEVWYSGHTILYKEEATCIPFAHITPIPRPHRHIGLSFYDLLADLQEINTMLSRQVLDNCFGSNHNELAVDESRIFEVDDLLTRRPNGIIRVRGNPQEALLPLNLDNASQKILPLMAWYDDKREVRTGVGKTAMGMDSDVLEKGTADAYQRGLAASSAMREGIARTFAETGVKDLMLLVHRMMMEYQDFEQLFRLQGLPAAAASNPQIRAQAAEQGLWIPVDPREWEHRTAMTVKVGLGHNTKMEEIQSLSGLAQYQQLAAQSGVQIVTPTNAYNLAEDTVRAMGFPYRANRYFTDPATLPPPQPQENPLVTAEKIKQITKAHTDEMKIQSDEKQQVRDLMVKLIELMQESQMKHAEMQMGDAARQTENLLNVSERIATQQHDKQMQREARASAESVNERNAAVKEKANGKASRTEG